MIIMKTDATPEEIAQVVKEVKKYGLRADVSQGAYRTENPPPGRVLFKLFCFCLVTS